MAFDLEPLGDRVVVFRIEEDAEMMRGLHIPEIAQVKSQMGRVMAVGEGRYLGGKIEPLPLSEGDLVLFGRYGGTEVNLDGVEYIILRFDEILLRRRLVAVVTALDRAIHVADS